MENAEGRHEVPFQVLGIPAGRPETERDRPRTDPWQLSGRSLSESPLQTALISQQPFIVGRHPDSDLCVDNPSVSRRHAEFVLTEAGLFVRDLGSTNGTFLNGQRVHDLEPLRDGDRLQFGAALFTVRPCGRRQTMATLSEDMGGIVLAYAQFDKLLSDPAVVPYFQPIVRFGDSRRVGYEVLARSRLPGLETPSQMFRVAAELGLERELSRLMRREGLRAGRILGPRTDLYLNTHPSELQCPKLLDSLVELRGEFPEAAIVLEVHEAAATSSCLLATLQERCVKLDIRLAYDDFGAGQSRLLELVEVPPHVIKFDMHLIRGIHKFSAERREMVRSLVQIARNLGVASLAEGVETADEAAACRELGFELAQGYFFGRPSPAKAWSTPDQATAP
jgi:EAL domain-containing protein (putative c-di-GMP-specific phosphodiesterase class I)